MPLAPYLVLCPMRIEFDAVGSGLRRAGIGAELAQVVQTGIGAGAIRRALGACNADEADRSADGCGFLEHGSCKAASGDSASCRSGGIRAANVGLAPGGLRGVVLAGLCGGLRSTAAVPAIREVVSASGERWSLDDSGWCAPCGAQRAGRGASGASLVGVDALVPGPEEKRALAAKSGADIVDMECHALAAWGGATGVPWTVVRGVSDRPEDVLPVEVLGWVTAAGDSRPARAVMDMVRKPRLIGHTVNALRRSKEVLPLVAERVALMIREREAQS